MAHRAHDVAHVASEPRVYVIHAGIGLLKGVVKHASGDHVLGCSSLVQQRPDLDQMRDERRAIDRTMLALMLSLGIGKCSLRLRESRRKSGV